MRLEQQLYRIEANSAVTIVTRVRYTFRTKITQTHAREKPYTEHGSTVSLC